MSYGVSAALQKAVFSALGADVDLQTALSGAIYDAVPKGQKPGIFVSLGPEVAKVRSDGTGSGAMHDITVSVMSSGDGFSEAKTIATKVSDVLNGSDLELERGQLVFMRFIKAVARRSRGAAGRQIDMIFRARVDDI